MIKLNLNILCIVIFFVVSAHAAKGQNYLKQVLTYKVTVNQVDCTIVAHIKPVNYISIQADKRYYWFSTNQINNTQGGYSGKLLNGLYQKFYANKNLKESGMLDKGLKAGVWKNWDEAGKLIADHTWNFGRKNGIYHKYDSAGKVMETGKYRNDLLNGKQKVFIGDSIKKVFYKHGKLTEQKKISMPGFISKIFHKTPKAM